MTPRPNLTQLEHEAHGLADRMPSLLVEAAQIANTLTHGIHGRKRHGPGETFWQFRHYGSTDSAQDIDWRRSATSDKLFVREREWEAAHTLWLWPDLSPSMSFRSHLSKTSKQERALVLTLAIGAMLARAGERIGLPGLMTPTSQYTAPEKLAHNINAHLSHEVFRALPTEHHLRRFSEIIVFSDFLLPVEEIKTAIGKFAEQGLRAHLVQILDPAEESLPYRGRVRFESMDGRHSCLAGRAQELREDYKQRLQLHRDAIRQEARRHRFSFMTHHTDRPAAEALLALYARLGANQMDEPTNRSTPPKTTSWKKRKTAGEKSAKAADKASREAAGKVSGGAR